MLTLDELQQRDFILSEKNNLVLVQPHPLKNLNRSKWKTEELPYRSAVLEKGTNKIVSLGFPKFFNYGEGGPSHIENSRFHKAIENGSVSLTEKLDGSLAVFSIYNGIGFWRTRGTLNYTDLVEAIEEKAQDYKDFLMSADSEYSWLFEFVGDPDYQVVLHYPEPELYLIGAVNHNDFNLLTDDKLDQIAQTWRLKRPKTIKLDQIGGTEVSQLIQEIQEWKSLEGVVARFGKNQQTLLKLKTTDYLLRHRLKSKMSSKNIREICIENNIISLNGFTKWIESQGGDWELIQEAKPLVEKFIEANNQAILEYKILEQDVPIYWMKFNDRGDFARNWVNLLPITHKGSAFMILDSLLQNNPAKLDQAWKMLQKNFLDEAFKDIDKKEESAILLAEND